MSVNQTVENVYTRQGAVQLTRKHFWRLLGMSVIVYAIVALLQHLLTKLGDYLMAEEVQAMLNTASAYLNANSLTSTEPLLNAYINLFTSPKFLLINLVYWVFTGLLSSGLNLGHTQQLVDTVRGGTPKVAGVFKLMRFSLKGWGLTLWTGLKTILWLLPGLVVFIVGAELQVYEFYTLGNLIGIAGVALICTLTIMAAIRYAQAVYILADEPDRGIRECVTFSKNLMKGCKGQYFRLSVPMLLRMLGIALIVSIGGNLILTVAGLEDSLLAAQIVNALEGISLVYFYLQLDVLFALYYFKRRSPAADAPISYWLRKPEPLSVQPVSYWLREHTATDLPPEAPAAAEEAPNADEAASGEDSPLPETTDDTAKEKDNEQPDC